MIATADFGENDDRLSGRAGDARVQRNDPQALYLQARGELKTQLKIILWFGRVRRHPSESTTSTQGSITDMANISERPPEVADRAIPGHWEGDLIIGKDGKSQIITLVERTSRFLPLARVPYDRCTDRVALILSMKVMARYFHREQFEDLGRGFFEEARTSVLGQESDVIPLPRQLRRHVSGWLSNERRVAAAAKRGTFLFTIARNPLRR
ncbi:MULTISPECIES: hypothetical protein [unclassified Frankia]|uniref:hypothetical protein n=1 Tax=unclassified Frankia TaxID=2632575 RepID=UPI001EF4ACCB|nr:MULTISPECIES: hypothetical protein [unclassified Frankia]